MRQVVLDTETTGLEPQDGHRIIEIGCVEVINRRLTGNRFHQYLQPEREIDAGAVEVHGITTEFLADKPRFVDVLEEFLRFVDGAELVIHNAPFDVGFINHELRLVGERWKQIDAYCSVLDTLALARRMHPGQKCSLDALCRRYEVDNSQRELHGALLDAEILAEVYLAMTGGQVHLSLGGAAESGMTREEPIRRVSTSRPALKVVRASVTEMAAHEERLDAIGAASGADPVWRRLENATGTASD